MEIRDLNYSDLQALNDLVGSVYSEYPVAMHFDHEPSDDELKDLFKAKMEGIRGGLVIDMIAKEEEKIIGECEIVKNSSCSGLIGIILRDGYRNRGIGSLLMDEAMRLAKGIGLESVAAEVDEKNKLAADFFCKNGFLLKGPGKSKNNRAVVLLEKKIS